MEHFPSTENIQMHNSIKEEFNSLKKQRDPEELARKDQHPEYGKRHNKTVEADQSTE